jgi:hypothetical protein
MGMKPSGSDRSHQGYYYDLANNTYYFLAENELIKYSISYDETETFLDHSLSVNIAEYTFCNDTIEFSFSYLVTDEIRPRHKWFFSKDRNGFVYVSSQEGQCIRVSRRSFNKAVQCLGLMGDG